MTGNGITDGHACSAAPCSSAASDGARSILGLIVVAPRVADGQEDDVSGSDDTVGSYALAGGDIPGSSDRMGLQLAPEQWTYIEFGSILPLLDGGTGTFRVENDNKGAAVADKHQVNDIVSARCGIIATTTHKWWQNHQRRALDVKQDVEQEIWIVIIDRR